MDVKVINGTGYGKEIYWTKNLNQVTLNFIGKIPPCDYTILTAINNGKKGVYLVENNQVTIGGELLNLGQLLLTIDYYVANNKIGSCQVVPIKIKLVEGEYELIPEITELRQEMEQLRESNNQLQQAYNKVCELINALYEINIKEIIGNE